jgi:predicted MFS family arabinose efflux permease
VSNAGYGFGLSTFVAGVVLVRFSALGSFSGKHTPRLRERIVALVLLGGGSVVVLVAFAVFASASHSPCPESSWPSPQKGETSNAMSFNKVVRSVAFSLGSAFGGLMLAAGTPTAARCPSQRSSGSAAGECGTAE